jgi:hypothetical protein
MSSEIDYADYSDDYADYSDDYTDIGDYIRRFDEYENDFSLSDKYCGNYEDESDYESESEIDDHSDHYEYSDYVSDDYYSFIEAQIEYQRHRLVYLYENCAK